MKPVGRASAFLQAVGGLLHAVGGAADDLAGLLRMGAIGVSGGERIVLPPSRSAPEEYPRGAEPAQHDARPDARVQRQAARLALSPDARLTRRIRLRCSVG